MAPEELETDSRSQATAYRILDANLNRCTEGLRVIEEYIRFSLEDQHLSRVCKQLRHDLVALAGQLPGSRLHTMRDVLGDVGTAMSAYIGVEQAPNWGLQ